MLAYLGSVLALLSITIASAWEPNWASLDSRPTPAWYNNSKFGIFIHWGLYSVPSWGIENGNGGSGEWFWFYWEGSEVYNAKPTSAYVDFVADTEAPGFTYFEYAPRFTAELFDPNKWSQLFADAGAQYVVLTAKHHEGFCMWNSSERVPLSQGWNAVDVGPHRDLVGELGTAVKSQLSGVTQRPLHYGLYHSLFEWYNPLYLDDQANNWTTTLYRDQKAMPELYDLVERYAPDLIWSDGDGMYGGFEAPDAYWDGPSFLAWYATNSSVAENATWNDRWGSGDMCTHGSFWTCADRFTPGHTVPHKWEDAQTCDASSWGFRRNADYSAYRPAGFFVAQLVEAVAFGGNFLLNIGPASDGTIPAVFADRLLAIGAWLNVSGDAIFDTEPWSVAQNESAVAAYYTQPLSGPPGTLYAITTAWPAEGVLNLTAPISSANTTAALLGYDGALAWSPLVPGGPGLSITLPLFAPGTAPCDYAWAIRLTDIANALPLFMSQPA